jgi:hypothetical protein
MIDATAVGALTIWKPFCENIATMVISFSMMKDIAEWNCNAQSPTVNATTVA